MKENKKNRFTKKNIVIAIIVALIIGLILIGVLSYINYSKDNDITTPSGEAKDLNISDEIVQDLFYLTRGELASHLFAGTDYENIYYRNDVTNINDMDEVFKKMLAFVTLDKDLIKQEESKYIISANDLKNQYNEIFGNLDTYQDETFNYNCPLTIEYNSESKQYEYESACGYSLSSGYVSKLTEAKEYNDRIEIYEVVAFYLLDDNTSEVSYFNTSDYSEYLTVLESENQFNIDDYTDRLDTYKYTFMKNGNNYYFAKVEKEK